jgi:two-component system NtrC family sensor kinase
MRKKQPRTMHPLPSSIPPERISRTTIIHDDEAVTSSRAVRLLEVPSLWIDRLLVATIELPYGEGQDAVVEALLTAISSIVPQHALGACFVKATGSASVGHEGSGQKTYQRVPHGARSHGAGVDATRLFPGFQHERVFEIVSSARAGSTLHVACDDDSLDDDRSAVVHIAKRAALALGRAVDHAHAYTAAAATKRELTFLEAHAIQADKLASFGEMAAGLVHELNNPLTSIVAYTDILLKKNAASGGRVAHPDEAEDAERLRRIGASANRMLRFTRDLVTYARPSSELAVPVVLHTVVDQALAFCEHVLAEANAQVERRFAPDALTVRGMPEQLTQVFVNLVTNACHALPGKKRGGIITLETCVLADPKRVRITVADDGHGILPEHVKQVFAPFFTTKRDGRGTGLGLSIVRNIVEHHGGTIRVESTTGVPSGTRFMVELPLGR